MRRFALAPLLLLASMGGACGHPGATSATPSKSDAESSASDTAFPAWDGGKLLFVPPPKAAKAEVRYLALGDSFTIGTGATPPEAFPSRWAARWGEACTPNVRNVAVNGYTTKDLIDRELPILAEFHPRWVSVAIGANDIVAGWSADTYRAHVKNILSVVLAAGVSADRVVVLPQPDWSLSPVASAFGSPSSIATKIESFNGILAEEAKAIGARFVDLFPLMRKQAQAGMIAKDGLHPSATAYDEWGEALSKSVPSPCS